MGERVKNAEIAFFGGSFTAIDREYMVSLLECARDAVKKYGFMGVRISTRPDRIDDEILDILKQYSVTSIELGAQSMDDRILEKNHRGHTASDIRRASAQIQEYGFSLGLQMMTGLYGSGRETDLNTAREIVSIHPDTVRIYPTVTLEDTELADLYREGLYLPPSLEETVSLCAEMIPLFEEAGIRVIRVGLHATEELCGRRIAGPYHPAFRELCMSRIFWNELEKKLKNMEKGEVTVLVNPRHLSQFLGQKKENLRKAQALGYELRIQQDSGVDLFEIIERKPVSSGT